MCCSVELLITLQSPNGRQYKTTNRFDQTPRLPTDHRMYLDNLVFLETSSLANQHFWGLKCSLITHREDLSEGRHDVLSCSSILPIPVCKTTSTRNHQFSTSESASVPASCASSPPSFPITEANRGNRMIDKFTNTYATVIVSPIAIHTGVDKEN